MSIDLGIMNLVLVSWSFVVDEVNGLSFVNLVEYNLHEYQEQLDSENDKLESSFV